jgi:mRNA interferase HigB
MRVHLIKEKTIRLFIAQYPGSRLSFEEWLTKVKLADWELPGDIKYTFPSADLLGKGSSRVIFDIAGNRYRLIGKYAFGGIEMHLLFAGSARMQNMINYVKKKSNTQLPFIKQKSWKP